MDNDFLSRLKEVLKTRYKTPWGASIGLARGTVDRMFRGEVPGPDKLCIIQQAENVSLDWLLAGRCRPYLLDDVPDADEAKALIKGILAGEPSDWRLDVLTDGLRHALLFSCVDRYYVDGRPVDYRHIRLITGNVAGSVLVWLDGQDLAEKRLLELQADTMEAVLRGRVGTFALFGDDERPGLLDSSARVLKLELCVQETSAAYGEPLTGPEVRLIQAFRRMQPCDRQRMTVVGEAILSIDADCVDTLGISSK